MLLSLKLRHKQKCANFKMKTEMTNSPKVSLIILNYNTWKLTIKELENIRDTIKYDNYDIIVVDNCSNNESVTELQEYARTSCVSFELIANPENRGYAAGNNVGIRRSLEKGSKYVFILNNDILFTDANTINDLVSYLENNQDVGAISPRIVSLDGSHDKPIYYRRPSFWDLFLGYPSFVKGKSKQDDNLVYDVYAPRGSCMMICNDFLKQVGLMDESTFLYYEEPILGEQLYRNGKRAINYGEYFVIHNHAETIKKNVPNKSILRFMVESQQVYLREYRNFNIFQCWLCKKVRELTYLIRH